MSVFFVSRPSVIAIRTHKRWC